MKNYFEMKTFVTVLLALVVFKIIDGLFLDKTVNKMLKKNESFESLDEIDFDDVDDEI